MIWSPACPNWHLHLTSSSSEVGTAGMKSQLGPGLSRRWKGSESKFANPNNESRYVPAVDSSRIIQHSTTQHSLPHIRTCTHIQYNSDPGHILSVWTLPGQGLPWRGLFPAFSFIRMPPQLSLFSLWHCILHTLTHARMHDAGTPKVSIQLDHLGSSCNLPRDDGLSSVRAGQKTASARVSFCSQDEGSPQVLPDGS